MGKTGKEEGRGRAGNGRKKRKREGEWQRGCKAGKAGIEGEEKRLGKERDGRKEGKAQEGR